MAATLMSPPRRTTMSTLLICYVAFYICSMATASFVVVPPVTSSSARSSTIAAPSSTSATITTKKAGAAAARKTSSSIRRVTSFLLLEQVPSSSSSPSPINGSNNDIKNRPKPPLLQADFELQELKIQLRAMKEQKVVTANQLQDTKRGELEGYVRRIVQRRPSPVPLWNIDEQLPSTKWRLGFSTQALTNESLPPGVLVYLQFGAVTASTSSQKKVDYVLEFTKTLGLNKLTAESTYQVDSSPIHPGWVTYTYESVKTDVFGFQNVGVPVGGLLKGRTSVIQTVYFDGDIWIESGKDGPSYEYFNVYVREVEDKDDWNA